MRECHPCIAETGLSISQDDSPRKVYSVLCGARRRMTHHVLEAVAPSEFIGQVGLAGHEVVPKLRCALKSDHYLSIHLQMNLPCCKPRCSNQLSCCLHVNYLLASLSVAHADCEVDTAAVQQIMTDEDHGKLCQQIAEAL